MEKSKKIYLDYASATPVDPRVFFSISKNLKENFANPSAIHGLGVEIKKKLEETRSNVAKFLSALSDEIIFTSGATESNNLAIIGVVNKYFQIYSRVPHVVTTNIEHSSVLEVFKYLEKNKKVEVTYVSVEKNGIVDPKKIKKAIKSNTILVSVMYANNEIGTIQPIREIAKEIRHFRKVFKSNFLNGLAERNREENRGPEKNYFLKLSLDFPFFHTDATQAINYLPINVLQLGVDLMSFNSAKIYGPKGIGVLFKKRNIFIDSITKGGDQEFSFRPGTENIPLVIGLEKALEITEKLKEKESTRLLKLRDYFIKKLISKNNNFEIKINGSLDNRLPNNINITIPKIPSDLLVIELSARGIYISEKSACKSGDKKGSYVIEAINGKQEGSLRFSLGRETTKEDIDYTVKSLFEILKKLKKWYNRDYGYERFK